MNNSAFFTELSRRGVFRVAAAYIVTAWALAKTAELVLDKFHAPEWALQAVLVALLVGFPIVVAITWMYDFAAASLELDLDLADGVGHGGGSITPSRDEGTAGDSAAEQQGIRGLWLWGGVVTFLLITGAIYAALLRGSDVAPDANDVATLSMAEQPPAIVVLPFANMSGDPGNEFFSDGIAETILNTLAKNENLKVISRSSAFSFKGKNIDIPTIAEQLQVNYVMEGSVLTSAERVRVNTQLIDPASDSQIWSTTYNGTLDDIFSVQDDIAREVQAQMNVVLTDGQSQGTTSSAEAYRIYLEARHLSRGGTEAAVNEAQRLFEQVLDLDPEYADAWTDLGLNQIRQASLGVIEESMAFDQARSSLKQSLRLNPDDATARSRLGWIALSQGRLEESAGYMEAAYAMEPGNSRVLINVGQLLSLLNRHEEAVAVLQQAVRLDPTSAFAYWNLSDAMFWSGDPEQGLAMAEKAERLSPGFWGIAHSIGTILLYQERYEEALLAFEREGTPEFRLSGTAAALYLLDRREEADQALEALIEQYGDSKPALLARVYIWRGDADAALAQLENATRIGDRQLYKLRQNPVADSLRSDARWGDFWSSIGWSEERIAAIPLEISLP